MYARIDRAQLKCLSALQHYARLFRDREFIESIANTIQFTVASVGIKLVVGMVIALLLNSKLPGRSILSGLMLLPWIVPEVVTALTWRGIFDPIFGGLNPILRGLGSDRSQHRLAVRDLGWRCRA